MRRREIIAGIGSATAWAVVARAQQAGKRPLIGFFGSSTPSAMTPWIAAFVQRLRELGWIEGRTVAIEYRWAEGRISVITRDSAVSGNGPQNVNKQIVQMFLKVM
jgi:putative ABC transport system substrate-binding protein